MGQLLLLLVVALTVAAVVFGVTVLVTGGDPGLVPAEPDGKAVPLPATRPLVENDVARVRFDTAVRGYRMAQVDQAMRRAAYDIGYKDELIGVLEAEVAALREGRVAEADVLRRAREAALAPVAQKPDPATDGAAGAEEEQASATEAAAAPIGPAEAATERANADVPDPTGDPTPAATETASTDAPPTAAEAGGPAPAVTVPADAPVGGDRSAAAANGSTVPSLRGDLPAEPAVDEGGIDSVTRAETPEDGRVGRPGPDRTEGDAAAPAVTPSGDAPAERR
ncbi:DivIVA domain-containing protein [Micromonospora pattaloongensis]|uniref:DivIVA domain-containing protein n=1 Tax=Micromonospora pattaloongensis TaxID=405436 RepID=A0A1H3GTA7_9ACTN|nr:DivIVA domain-containing protein [Micromonospora pattaloongensis]